MLLQIKLYMVSVLYLFGILFMILFPPRNYEQSGAKMRKIRSTGSSLKYLQYIDQETLLNITNRMAKEDPEMVRLVHLTPRTSNNNSIIALELHSDTHSRKPGILIIGTLNGMVWGTTNAIIELAEKLLYDANYQTPFFNDYDWYLIPVVNPDALNFTKSLRKFRPIQELLWSRNITARNNTRPSLWHKNVNTELGDTCFGTNINRNFAYHWRDDVSKPPDVCSQYYPGTRPFSAAESQAIRTYIHKLEDVLQIAINVHASFVPKKEFILYPWRYSLRQPSNYRNLQAIGEYAARQARLPDGRLYEVHQESSDGRVAGSLTDYISGVLGTDLVFLLKPFHPTFPNISDTSILETYVKKTITSILSLVRGWRSSTKQNTLSFFGRDVEF
ncbi:zinc carboxypeptidase-like [Zerene cesonia]|uniref:zinc carboxypeptidase-like n=1 Tax=Zerene cesonia TaxID=33412 RepID=UPI0018E4FA89|nr:zinc carboxypeptidase-like [Zerene cesonia]